MEKIDILRETNIGERIAEEESQILTDFFLETHIWEQFFAGEIDVVYGAKGAGKSALYLNLLRNRAKLKKQNRIVLVEAENPTGHTAFAGMVNDPPPEEKEFIHIWKLYALILITDRLLDSFPMSMELLRVRLLLNRSQIDMKKNTLSHLFESANLYVKKLRKVSSIQPGVDIDSNSGLISGFYGKVTFDEVSTRQRGGFVSVDSLLNRINKFLNKRQTSVWIAFDRLDVAFIDSKELEENAIRGLFRVYRDFKSLNKIDLKIFLRDDIWRRLVKKGYREASHITKTVTISWNHQSLLNMLVKRFVRNSVIIREFNIDVEKLEKDYTLQEQFFYRMLPLKIESGTKKPSTLNWLLKRIADGKGVYTPRELIHWFKLARNKQIEEIELGRSNIQGENLFQRSVFKDVHVEVSKVRFEQTLLAEYPQVKSAVMALEGNKSTLSVSTLAELWDIDEDDIGFAIEALVDIGFFTRTTYKGLKVYQVPHIYRPYLKLVQGMA
jgi:hypothetical protein